MRNVTDAVVDPDPPEDDVTYRRVIWTLYIVGLALNVWLIWEMVMDTPDVEIQLRKMKAWYQRRIVNCEGCAKRKARLKAMINQTHWEAIQIVTEAQEHDTRD